MPPPFIMHHPGDTESLLHGSRARRARGMEGGGVGGRLGRQARFWEAATRDDLVIGLSGRVSVSACAQWEFILTRISRQLDLRAAGFLSLTSSFSAV